MRDFIQTFLLCVEAFFLLYMVLYSSFLFLSVTVGSSDLYAARRRNRLKNELSNDYYVPVSVLVPAHNEEVTIEATIRSLLTLDYKLYEIVVVDDGSTDNTTQVLRDAFHMWKIERPIQRRIPCQPEEEIYETRAYKVPITLVRKKNGGKADALNMGINVASYPYFLCLDADSVLQHDSLEKIVRWFVGVDFGWEHYGAFVLMGKTEDGRYYLVQEWATQHQHIDRWVEIARSIKAQRGDINFYCDGARPDYVQELRKTGIRAIYARKDVVAGISEVASLYKQRRLFIVQENAPRFAQEIYGYVWKPGADEPVKTNDDVQDAVRYAIYSDLLYGR